MTLIFRLIIRRDIRIFHSKVFSSDQLDLKFIMENSHLKKMGLETLRKTLGFYFTILIINNQRHY